MLKDIIEMINKDINNLNEFIKNEPKEKNRIKKISRENSAYHILMYLNNYLSAFKKEAELQERMIKALIIFCYEFEKCKNENPGTFSMYHYCKNNFIPIIEKYYNKSWEEIIKE